MKKFLSSVIAVGIAIASVCTLSANAEYVMTTPYLSNTEALLDQLIPVETPSFMQKDIESLFRNHEQCIVYRYKSEDRLKYEIFGLEKSPRYASIKLTEDVERQSVNDFLKESGYEYAYVDFPHFGDTTVSLHGETSAEMLKQAEDECRLLKDAGMITSFVYHPYYYLEEYFDYGTDSFTYWGTGITKEDMKDDTADMDEGLNKLIGEKGLAWHTEVASNQLSVKIVPDIDVTVDDRAAVAELVCDELGYTPRHSGRLEDMAYYYSMGSIDMYNAVGGDANCDMVLSIADATAVLQSIVNPAKYPLTIQGEYNADIDGDHDGITPADALAIQMLDAGQND